MNDNMGYTLIGTTTLLTTYSWAAVATVAAVGLAVYIAYDKTMKDTSLGDAEGEWLIFITDKDKICFYMLL